MQTLALTPFHCGDRKFAHRHQAESERLSWSSPWLLPGLPRKDDLFALSLAVTAFNLLVRIPMGLAMGAPLVEEAVEVKSELVTKRKAGVTMTFRHWQKRICRHVSRAGVG